MIDYSYWDLKDKFTVREAATLWVNVDPKYYKDAPRDACIKALRFTDTLRKALADGRIARGRPIDALLHNGVTRADLIRYAIDNRWKPLFLFPEERGKPGIETSLEQKGLPSKKEPFFTPSNDYRNITLEGETYTLTTQEAQVIELLHLNSPNSLSLDRIYDSIGDKRDRSLKKAVFKKNKELYEKLIETPRKGTYRLKLDKSP